MKILRKNIFTLFLSLAFIATTYAQINGNGNIQTKKIVIENIQQLDLEIVANVEIDGSMDKDLEIIADENILEYIAVETDHNKLRIGQAKWIESSKSIIIKMSSTTLQSINTSGYSTVNVKNLNQKEFKVMPIVGKMVLSGMVENLRIGTESGFVDATQVKATNVFANAWSRGKILAAPIDLLEVWAQKGGQIIYNTTPNKIKKHIKSNGQLLTSKEDQTPKKEAKYIDLKLNNNSGKKIDIYVKGPSHRRFSYGIPFQAFQKRKERFPIGTRIYLEHKVGTRTLLVTIEEEDENEVVDLFEDKK